MKLSWVILFVSLNVANVFGQEEYCYANDGDKKQTKHYSTKTPYEVARGTDKKYFSVPSETYLIKNFETNLHIDNFLFSLAQHFRVRAGQVLAFVATWHEKSKREGNRAAP